eukprot:ANDGO_03644.mRNA.1 putative serine/threonine-protein kinase nek3
MDRVLIHPHEANLSYRITRAIGQGSFGTAYLAVRSTDLKQVCIKHIPFIESRASSALHASVSSYPNLLERHPFEDYDSALLPAELQQAIAECRLLQGLSHPNVIAFFDCFYASSLDVDDQMMDESCRSSVAAELETEKSKKSVPDLYIVTEYADSGDLSLAIQAASAKVIVFTEEQVMSWFLQLLFALDYLHKNSVFHRDIKTANVFLSMEARCVKLGDFGIARQLKEKEAMATTVCGTPHYMAPECCEYGMDKQLSQGHHDALANTTPRRWSDEISAATRSSRITNPNANSNANASAEAAEESVADAILRYSPVDLRENENHDSDASWMPLEIVSSRIRRAGQVAEQGYTAKSDIWSLGCVLYETCMLKRAFDAASLPSLMMKVVNGRVQPIPKGRFSDGLRLLCLQCLERDPRKRPSTSELLGAEFVQKWIGKLGFDIAKSIKAGYLFDKAGVDANRSAISGNNVILSQQPGAKKPPTAAELKRDRKDRPRLDSGWLKSKQTEFRSLSTAFERKNAEEAAAEHGPHGHLVKADSNGLPAPRRIASVPRQHTPQNQQSGASRSARGSMEAESALERSSSFTDSETRKSIQRDRGGNKRASGSFPAVEIVLERKSMVAESLDSHLSSDVSKDVPVEIFVPNQRDHRLSVNQLENIRASCDARLGEDLFVLMYRYYDDDETLLSAEEKQQAKVLLLSEKAPWALQVKRLRDMERQLFGH